MSESKSRRAKAAGRICAKLFAAGISSLLLSCNHYNAAAGGILGLEASQYRRRQLTFDNSQSSTPLTNFPVYIELNGSRIDYSMAGTNGENIRFYDSDGVTLIAHQIEKWNAGGTSAVWVKVPQIDARSNTDSIWMYYGTPVDAALPAASVWSDSFAAVYHMDTAQSETGTNNGTNTATTSAAGKIGNARSFDGTSAKIAVGSTGYDSDAGTLECWIQPSVLPTAGGRRFIFRHNNAGNTRIYMHIYDTGGEFRIAIGNHTDGSGVNASGQSTSVGVWSHLVLVWSSPNFRAYFNGTQVLSNTYADFNPPLASTIYVGSNNGVMDFFGGLIDEMRISNTARSADWIYADYLSQSGSFVSYGTESIPLFAPGRATGL